MFKDNNVLLGGLPQAQVLTNTIEINSFPQQIEDAISNGQYSKVVDRNVQNAIFSSHLLDAQQVKLPKVKLIDRPAYNLPRLYGISHERRKYVPHICEIFKFVYFSQYVSKEETVLSVISPV